MSWWECRPDWQALVPEFVLRRQQLDALEWCREAYAEGAEVVLLEAPPGVGKSIIQLAMCRLAEGRAYVCTPQKVLQDQLARLPGVVPMKGRGSYKCALVPALRANAAPCVLSPSVREKHEECDESWCPYFRALAEAKASDIVAHSYASLLAQSAAGHFGPRGLLCLDESHTAVHWIRMHMALDLPEADLMETFGDRPSEDPLKFMGWLRARVALWEDDDEQGRIPDKIVIAMAKMRGMRFAYGVPAANELREAFQESEEGGRIEDWAAGHLSAKPDEMIPWHCERGRDMAWRCTPLRVGPMSSVLMGLGSRILMVSATILDAKMMLVELGMRGRKHAMVSVGTPFHPRNRQIHRRYVGSVSRASDDLMDRMAAEIASIMDEHEGQRGIVHTNSYQLCADLVPRLRALTPRRVVTLEDGPREQVIAGFLSGDMGVDSALVAPGLLEGIDGAGDSARWQAMCKVPWPYRGDPVVSRVLDDPKLGGWASVWYEWKAAQMAVQGFGRVCRSEDDHGDTYLLDSGFERMLQSRFMPSYVLDAVRRSR